MATPPGSGNQEPIAFLHQTDVAPPPLIIPEEMAEYQQAHAAAGLALDQSVAVQFGPNSILRPELSDMRNMFTIFSTGLLQLGHPVIGTAVAKHSRLLESPWERFDSSARAITQVFLSENGTVAGHRIRDYHRGIFGTDEHGNRVSAMHPEPYVWGWLTILDMAEQKRRRFQPKAASDIDWDQWYQEGRVAYQCQGVSDHYLPPDYESYREYIDEVCETRLQRTPAIDNLLEQIDEDRIARPPQVPPILWNRLAEKATAKFIRLIAVGGLPGVAREKLSLEWKRSDQLALTALEQAVKIGWKAVPERLTYHPANVRDILPPTGLHHEMLYRAGDWFAGLQFEDKAA